MHRRGLRAWNPAQSPVPPAHGKCKNMLQIPTLPVVMHRHMHADMRTRTRAWANLSVIRPSPAAYPQSRGVLRDVVLCRSQTLGSKIAVTQLATNGGFLIIALAVDMVRCRPLAVQMGALVPNSHIRYKRRFPDSHGPFQVVVAVAGASGSEEHCH